MRAVAGDDDQWRAARESHAAKVRHAAGRSDETSGAAGMTRIYVPCDSSALALGADKLAAAIVNEAAQRGVGIELIRNGSRGLLYLEPLVEVETPAGRVGYANVDASDVASLFDAGFVEGK